MINIILGFLSLLITYIIFDIVWVTKVADKFYRSEVGEHLLDKYVLLPGIIFYAIFSVVVFYLASYQGYLANDVKIVLLNSFLLGLLAYGTYNLVNLSTLQNWSSKLLLVDMTYGVIVTMVVGYVGFVVTKHFIF